MRSSHGRLWTKAGLVDRDVWRKAGREGLLCPMIPVEYGGGGGDFGHSAVLSEEMAALGISGVTFGMHSDIIAPYILRLGTEEQKRGKPVADLRSSLVHRNS